MLTKPVDRCSAYAATGPDERFCQQLTLGARRSAAKPTESGSPENVVPHVAGLPNVD